MTEPKEPILYPIDRAERTNHGRKRIAAFALSLVGAGAIVGIGINKFSTDSDDNGAFNKAKPDIPVATASRTPSVVTPTQEQKAPAVTDAPKAEAPRTATVSPSTTSREVKSKPRVVTYESATANDIAKVSVGADERGMTVTPALRAPDGQYLSTVNLPYQSSPTGKASVLDYYHKPASGTIPVTEAKIVASEHGNRDSNTPVLLVMKTAESGDSTSVTYTDNQPIDLTQPETGVVTLATSWVPGEQSRIVDIGTQFTLMADELNPDKTAKTRDVSSNVGTFVLDFGPDGSIIKASKQN